MSSLMKLVQWSVENVNETYGDIPIPLNEPCPCCGRDMWYRVWGIDPIYASEWNPGEYIKFICSKCGYSYEEPC